MKFKRKAALTSVSAMKASCELSTGTCACREHDSQQFVTAPHKIGHSSVISHSVDKLSRLAVHYTASENGAGNPEARDFSWIRVRHSLIREE